MLGSLLGFASPAAQADVIWEGNDQSVSLAPQDDPAAPPNDHPANLAPQDIERMLGALRFRFADQEDDARPAAVFNSEQVEILGEALATGLTRATPSEDVTFSVIGAHRLSPGAFARRNRLTAGRAFFRDGKLNLILGDIQSPHRKKNIYGRIEEDFHPRQYGSRAAPQEEESLLVAGTLATLHGSSGERRHDWVVFDPDAVGAAESRPAASTRAGEPAAAPDVAPRPTEPAASPQDGGRSAASAAPTPARPQPEGDIEDRLETLKRLRERDLISEEAYRQKVDEILDEL